MGGVDGFMMTVMGLAEPLERAAELEKLSALLAAAREGRGQVCVIEGPSGVGKSRLLDACADSAAALGMSVVRARCSELTRDYPFGVARGLFEPGLIRAGQELRDELMRGPAGLARPVFAGDEAATDEFAVIYGLYWLTVNLAEQRPMAILIDDAPWADDFTLRFLVYLAERVDDLAAAVVVVIRSGDPGAESQLIGDLWQAASVPPIRPAELSESAVAELLAAELPDHTIDPELAQTVSRETGGNPLFVVAVADAIRAGEDVAITTPESMRRHVVRRMARLDPAARALSKAAAVLGDDAAIGDVIRLADLGQDVGLVAAAELVQANVLACTDPIMFAHGIIRMAIYSVLEPAERLTLHSGSAKLLADRRSAPEAVAEHLMKCGAIDETWGAGALHDAGRAATRKGAPAAAIRYLRRAFEASDAHTVPPRLLIDLGLAEAAAGEPTSLDRFAQALEMVTERGERADALYSLGQTLHAIGRFPEASAAFRRGAALFEDDTQAWLRFHGAAASAEFFITTPAQRMQPEIIRPDDLADGSGTRVVLAMKSLQEAVSVPPAQWAGYLAMRALGDGALLAEQTSQGPSVNLAVQALLYAGRLSEAQDAADAAVRDARERGALLAHVEASYVRALVFYARGRITEAAADAQAALDGLDWRWHDHRQRAVAILLHCMVERDELNEAGRLIERADQELPVPIAQGIFALLHLARGRVHFRLRNYDAARQEVEAAANAVADYGPVNPAAFPWRSLAGEIAHFSGDHERARSLIDEEVALAELFDVPIGLGIALRRRAITETGDQALDTLQQAVAALERTEARLELARTHAALGSALRRAGQRVSARSHLQKGLDLAHRGGATGVETQLREELTAAGGRPRRSAVTGVESLTPTELRVAELGAEGLSNRQIAELIFVSRNTIAWHLRNIYRKLQVESREQISRSLQV